MPNTPSQNGLVLSLLRMLQGWNQKNLSAASGVQGNLLSDYERGRKPLSRERLEMLASTMGRTPEFIESVFAFLRKASVSAPVAGRPSDAQNWRIELVVSDIAAMAADFTRRVLTRVITAARAEEERQEAKALWATLKTRKPPERRRLVEAVERFRNWALCELVCRESVDAARDSADRALELADLALRIAELTPGDEAWRSRVQGYAWAHAGNARRVKGDLPAADEAFRRAGKLWRGGEDSDSSLLDRVRVLDLEASLRREQRRFSEALELLDQALAADCLGQKPSIMLSKANVLHVMGDFQGSATMLRQAAPLIKAEGETQMLFALQFNLAVNLCLLELYQQAEELLPETRALAMNLRNGLDLVRLHWLEGRVAAGLGRREEARKIISKVQQEFTTRKIAFDAALASLELAVLFLEEDQAEEVRDLARQTAWIFRVQGVHREAFAALRLFWEAAEKDRVTLNWARQLLFYLYRAQHDPGLQFEGVK